MTAIKRLHTAAVDVAFAHGHVETELECAARERAGDHVREIALWLDDAIYHGAKARAEMAVAAGDGYTHSDRLLSIADTVRRETIRAFALRDALEMAIRSHGCFLEYRAARQALEACEAPNDA